MQNGQNIPNKEVSIQSNQIITLIYIVSILNMVMYYMIPLNLPFFLKSIDPTMTATKISVALALETFTAAVFPVFYKKIKERASYATLSGVAFVIMAIAYFLIGNIASYEVTLIASMMYGIGSGIMMPNCSLWIISVTKPHNRGLVIGGMYSAIYMGKFASSLLIYVLSKHFNSQACYIIPAFLMFSFAALLFFVSKKNFASSNN